MPLYRCMTPDNALSQEQRAQIAADITDIHCEVTGAPRTFVHVFFFPDGNDGTYTVLGSVRAGRTDEQKRQLHARIAEAVASCAGVPVSRVKVKTIDVPAKWIMEGGALLPEPGEEDAWLASHTQG